jgi:hypothetical protein
VKEMVEESINYGLNSKHSPISTEIIQDKDEIMRYLPLGTNIPILPEFKKYIKRNLERFQDVQSILLREQRVNSPFSDQTDDIEGHVLLFNDGSNTLFFGFFGVFDHNPLSIDILLDKIHEIAQNSNYGKIRGPVNIPSNIFGMGFMMDGSSKELFICRPVTPPIYYERFLEHGFDVIFEEDQYRCTFFQFDPRDHENPLAKRYEFSDYEFIYFENKEQILEYVDEIIKMHVKYMPPSASITPKIQDSARDIIDIVCEFGDPKMVWVVKYKPTNQVIASGYILPNMFSEDDDGNINTISMHDWVVHPDHRRKGMTIYMYGMLSLELMPPKGHLSWGIWQVGKDNVANSKAAQNMGGKLERTLVVLEKVIH